LYPVLPLFLSRACDPADFIGSVSPRPVLLIHGDQDRIVPVWMSERLYAAAREPKKIWIIRGAGHLACRATAGKKYEEEIAGFLKDTH